MAWSGESCLQMLSYDAVQACLPHLRGPVLAGECGVRHAVSPQQETVPPQVLPCVLQQLSKPTAVHRYGLPKSCSPASSSRLSVTFTNLTVLPHQIPRTLRS